jgi:hypothetical protein
MGGVYPLGAHRSNGAKLARRREGGLAMVQNGMDAPPEAGAASRWLDYGHLTLFKVALLVVAGFLVGALAGWLTS